MVWYNIPHPKQTPKGLGRRAKLKTPIPSRQRCQPSHDRIQSTPHPSPASLSQTGGLYPDGSTLTRTGPCCSASDGMDSKPAAANLPFSSATLRATASLSSCSFRACSLLACSQRTFVPLGSTPDALPCSGTSGAGFTGCICRGTRGFSLSPVSGSGTLVGPATATGTGIVTGSGARGRGTGFLLPTPVAAVTPDDGDGAWIGYSVGRRLCSRCSSVSCRRLARRPAVWMSRPGGRLARGRGRGPKGRGLGDGSG